MDLLLHHKKHVWDFHLLGWCFDVQMHVNIVCSGPDHCKRPSYFNIKKVLNIRMKLPSASMNVIVVLICFVTKQTCPCHWSLVCGIPYYQANMALIFMYWEAMQVNCSTRFIKNSWVLIKNLICWRSFVHNAIYIKFVSNAGNDNVKDLFFSI